LNPPNPNKIPWYATGCSLSVSLRKTGTISAKYHEMCDEKICPTGSELKVFILLFLFVSCSLKPHALQWSFMILQNINIR
jgi:hypothetical protein